MLNKIEIILVIIALLIIYYLVISFGSGHRKKKDQSHKIKKYLFNIRILIILIAFVGIALTFFL